MDYFYKIYENYFNTWKQHHNIPFKKPDAYKNINTNSFIKK